MLRISCLKRQVIRGVSEAWACSRTYVNYFTSFSKMSIYDKLSYPFVSLILLNTEVTLVTVDFETSGSPPRHYWPFAPVECSSEHWWLEMPAWQLSHMSLWWASRLQIYSTYSLRKLLNSVTMLCEIHVFEAGWKAVLCCPLWLKCV